MRELELSARIAFTQYASREQLVDGLDDLLTRGTRRRCDRDGVDFTAGYGDDVEHAAGGGRETGKPGDDRVAHAARHVLVGAGTGGDALEHFLDEQRVTGCALVETASEILDRLPDPAGDEARDGRLIKSAERDGPTGAVAAPRVEPGA